MPTLLIRDLPPDLHQWLREDAEAHHRSANRHTIALLESIRARGTDNALARDAAAHRDAALAQVAVIQRKIAIARDKGKPEITNETALGYDANGLPA